MIPDEPVAGDGPEKPPPREGELGRPGESLSASVDPEARDTSGARRGIPMGLITWGVVLLVLVAVVALVTAKLLTPSPSRHPVAFTPSLAPATVAEEITNLPSDLFARAGVPTTSLVAPPVKIVRAPLLRLEGRPLVLATGAAFCPYCASQSWALVIALSRFGRFSHLAMTHSSDSAVFPGSVSISLEGATYTSRYLALRFVEQYADRPESSGGIGFARTGYLSPGERRIVDRFDAPPYVPAVDAGTLPFTDIANQAVMAAYQGFSPGLLNGLTIQQAAADIADPSMTLSKAVLGTANLLTAAICRATGGQPGGVCSTSTIQAASAALATP